LIEITVSAEPKGGSDTPNTPKKSRNVQKEEKEKEKEEKEKEKEDKKPKIGTSQTVKAVNKDAGKKKRNKKNKGEHYIILN
jgi:hypothetical protein